MLTDGLHDRGDSWTTTHWLDVQCVHAQDDSKLLASVTGIIDGTGSIGAALQGVLISWISSQYSWNAVFYALIAW